MRSVLIILFILVFTGCSSKNNQFKQIAQSHNAKEIRSDYDQIIKLLWEYKQKLDKRNPNKYSKTLKPFIKKEINNITNSLTLLSQDSRILKNNIDYLNIAFNKNQYIKNRSDYLILGLYKLIYDAYSMKQKHKLTALGYDKNKLKKLYKNIQILKWKIANTKNNKEEFIFITWQNNWQIELIKYKGSNNLYEKIKDLKYIENKKESIFDPSNFNFELILSDILNNIERSLSRLDDEPEKLSIDTLVSLVFII